MIKNELMTTGDRDKYAHIFDKLGPVKSDYIAPTNEEITEKQDHETISILSDLFDEDIGSMEFFTSDYADSWKDKEDTIIKMTEEFSISADSLEARTEAENIERFEDSQFIFNRKIAEDKGLTEPDFSQSTEYVISQSTPEYAKKLGHNSYKRVEQVKASGGFGSQPNRSNTGFGHPTPKHEHVQSGYGSRGSVNNKTTPNKKAEAVKHSANEVFPDINSAVVSIGSQPMPGWVKSAAEVKKEQEERSYFEQYTKNRPWWKKALSNTKSFIKGKKGRVMLKFGTYLAMNLAMGVFSKRLEFENSKQMTAMFAFMMGSFFLSRELSEEGINMNGFGY